MPEMPNHAGHVALDLLEWRPARLEDGPVWVALTREGRTPLIPREAIIALDRLLAEDQKEGQDELAQFRATFPKERHQQYLLWCDGWALGRLCFSVQNGEAYLGGMALLPRLGPLEVEQVARTAIQRAVRARAKRVRAVVEARYQEPFLAAGFHESFAYTTLVAATRWEDNGADAQEEEEPSRAPKALAPLYRIRPTQPGDGERLGECLEQFAAAGQQLLALSGPFSWWAEEMERVLGNWERQPVPECSFVAETQRLENSQPVVAGAIQLTRWQHVVFVEQLFVLVPHQRQGVGTALVRQALATLQQRGDVALLALGVQAESLPGFYRQAGFRDVPPGFVILQRTLREE